MGTSAWKRLGEVGMTHFDWRCPKCKAALLSRRDALACENCSAYYEVITGIPDLRVPGDSWIDFNDDLVIARELAANETATLPDLVRSVYSRRAGWDEARIALRTRQVLEAPDRLEDDVSGWLAGHLEPDSVALDLGCGAGMLLAAAARRGCQGIGIDVSMTWLVVAKRMISEHGGTPVLAAAMGEALPLASECVDAVVSLDVIEHVRDPRTYLREIDRVTKLGGQIALSTPNRFSLTPEPHVFVWGVGWLPHAWQAPYVRWASGKTYDDTRLLSSFGLARLLRGNTKFGFRLLIPPVSKHEIDRFGAVKATLARWYNALCTWTATRGVFLIFGPFFRVVGRKS